MRMSLPACVSLGVATVLVLATYAVNPDTGFLLTALPMLLVLVAVPLLLHALNQRQAANMDVRDIHLYKIKDIGKLSSGTAVRIRGTVETVSFRWLNRPHFRVSDGTGTVGVVMFIAPRGDIRRGDRIEAVGSLRSLGVSKEKKVWGVKMEKLDH